jgi:hypothetical protein
VTALRSSWTRLVVAGVIPVAVAAAWILLRDRLPNTDLALLLIVVIGTIGWLIGPMAALVAAVAGAVAFDVMDARPYGTLTISRGNDITTALILLATGLLVGAGAARLARYRRSEDERSDALAVVMEASGLVATGEEEQLITEALAAELQRALQLTACEFSARPPSGTRPSVARDGSLVGLLKAAGRDTSPQVDLPVWSQGEVLAHYRLTLGAKTPTQGELRVALSLADQAGAAMAHADHDPSPPPSRPARLRLLSPGSSLAPRGEPHHPAAEQTPKGRLAAAPPR